MASMCLTCFVLIAFCRSCLNPARGVLAKRGEFSFQAGKIFAVEDLKMGEKRYSVRFADGWLDFDVPAENIKSQKLVKGDKVEVLSLEGRKTWMPAKVVEVVTEDNIMVEFPPQTKSERKSFPRDQISKRRLRDLRDDLVYEYAMNNGSEVRYIDLEGCRNISDQTLSALARSCDKLEEIDLLSATGVSGSGILQLVTDCTDLSLDRVTVPRPTPEEKKAKLLSTEIKRDLKLPENKDDPMDHADHQQKVCLKLLRWLDDKPAVASLDLRGLGPMPLSIIKLLATNLPGLRRGGLLLDQVEGEWPARKKLFAGGGEHLKMRSEALRRAQLKRTLDQQRKELTEELKTEQGLSGEDLVQHKRMTDLLKQQQKRRELLETSLGSVVANEAQEEPNGDETRKLPLDLWVSATTQAIDKKVEELQEKGTGVDRSALISALDDVNEHRVALIKATLDGSLNKHLVDPEVDVSNAQVSAECCLRKTAETLTAFVNMLDGTAAGEFQKYNVNGTVDVLFGDGKIDTIPQEDVGRTHQKYKKSGKVSTAKIPKGEPVTVTPMLSLNRAHLAARLAYMEHAMPLRKAGRWDDADAVYDKAIAEDQGNTWARDTKAYIHMARHHESNKFKAEDYKTEMQALATTYGYTKSGMAPNARAMLYHALTSEERSLQLQQ